MGNAVLLLFNRLIARTITRSSSYSMEPSQRCPKCRFILLTVQYFYCAATFHGFVLDFSGYFTRANLFLYGSLFSAPDKNPGAYIQDENIRMIERIIGRFNLIND